MAIGLLMVPVIVVSLCVALCYLCWCTCFGSCCCLRSPKRRRQTALRQATGETYGFAPDTVWIELHKTVPGARRHFEKIGVDTSKLRSHNNLFAFWWRSEEGGDGRFYFGYRIAPTHFPSKSARLLVFSTSEDPMLAQEWAFEFEVHTGCDLREPQFFALDGKLFFYWFAMVSPRCWSFEPSGVYFRCKAGSGQKATWSTAEQPTLGATRQGFDASTVPWDVKTHMGRAWLMIYTGDHYGVKDAMRVVFLSSADGQHWDIAGCSADGDACCYVGGACETAFEFCGGGREVVAYSRNEDGDARHGFGTVILKGVRQGDTTPPVYEFEDCTRTQRAVRYRFDSPRMFTHGASMYMVARYVYSPNDIWCTKCLPLALRKFFVLFMYSARPKATALYRVAEDLDLEFCCFVNPSSGDTGFPSVVQLESDSFLVTNYTSRLPDAAPWILGQLRSTSIYMTRLTIQADEGGQRPRGEPDRLREVASRQDPSAEEIAKEVRLPLESLPGAVVDELPGAALGACKSGISIS